MSETHRAARTDDTNVHLQDLEDGCGCAEVREHLFEERAGRTEGD